MFVFYSLRLVTVLLCLSYHTLSYHTFHCHSLIWFILSLLSDSICNVYADMFSLFFFCDELFNVAHTDLSNVVSDINLASVSAIVR